MKPIIGLSSHRGSPSKLTFGFLAVYVVECRFMFTDYLDVIRDRSVGLLLRNQLKNLCYGLPLVLREHVIRELPKRLSIPHAVGFLDFINGHIVTNDLQEAI